jgi:DNA-binding CsgD family transcriptional regulator
MRLRLTTIELDTLGQIMLGRSNADIARARHRAVGTVAKQVVTVCHKFGVTTRRELKALLQREALVEVGPEASTSSTLPPNLTHRERDVLSRVANGQSNKRIAADLGVAESTIAVFLSRARRKLRGPERSA